MQQSWSIHRPPFSPLVGKPSMRTHPFVASLAAMLLCVALAACSSQADSAQKPDETPLDADSATEEEADTTHTSPAAPQDDRRHIPLGWDAHPQEPEERDEDNEDEESEEEEEEEGEGDDTPVDAVTGGEDGKTVTASDTDELTEHLASEEPLTIEVSGEIDLDGDTHVPSNTTLVGEEAVLSGGRLIVEGAHNVVLDGLRIEAGDTAVAVRGRSHHVWVHGSTFVGGKDDSLVSITDGADHVTLSWNHFREATSVLAIGDSDDRPGALHVTVHHNFFDGTSGRHPRARFAEHVHVITNSFLANACNAMRSTNDAYGVRSTHEANVLVEGNYFESTALSVATEEDEPGNAVARDNLLVDSEQPMTRGSVSDPPYVYELDETAQVPELVRAGAGVM